MQLKKFCCENDILIKTYNNNILRDKLIGKLKFKIVSFLFHILLLWFYYIILLSYITILILQINFDFIYIQLYSNRISRFSNTTFSK